jgi:magnesium transporter
MVTFYYKGIRHKKLKTLAQKRVGVWVHAENPTEEEIAILVRDFSLEKDLLDDALDPNEVPRMEQEEGIVYVFVQVPYKQEGSSITTHPVLIAIGSDFVLTLSRRKVDFLCPLIEGKREITTTQRIKMLINFWFGINDSYTRYLARMGKELRSLSSEVEHIGVEDLTKFVEYEKTSNDFLAALIPMRAIVHTLLSQQRLHLYEEDKELVEDLFLAMGQLVEMSRATHRHVVNIRESSSVIMTHTLNRSIRTLTVLTIVLSIPMILASFYGMNVSLPLESWNFMFWVILSSSLVAMGFSLAFLLRK